MSEIQYELIKAPSVPLRGDISPTVRAASSAAAVRDGKYDDKNLDAS